MRVLIRSDDEMMVEIVSGERERGKGGSKRK